MDREALLNRVLASLLVGSVITLLAIVFPLLPFPVALGVVTAIIAFMLDTVTHRG